MNECMYVCMYVRAAILRYLAYEWSSGWEDQLLSHILSAHHQAFQAIPDFKVAKDGHDSLTHRGNLTPFPCYTVKYYTHMYTYCTYRTEGTLSDGDASSDSPEESSTCASSLGVDVTEISSTRGTCMAVGADLSSTGSALLGCSFSTLVMYGADTYIHL